MLSIVVLLLRGGVLLYPSPPRPGVFLSFFDKGTLGGSMEPARVWGRSKDPLRFYKKFSLLVSLVTTISRSRFKHRQALVRYTGSSTNRLRAVTGLSGQFRRI